MKSHAQAPAAETRLYLIRLNSTRVTTADSRIPTTRPKPPLALQHSVGSTKKLRSSVPRRASQVSQATVDKAETGASPPCNSLKISKAPPIAVSQLRPRRLSKGLSVKFAALSLNQSPRTAETFSGEGPDVSPSMRLWRGVLEKSCLAEEKACSALSATEDETGKRRRSETVQPWRQITRMFSRERSPRRLPGGNSPNHSVRRLSTSHFHASLMFLTGQRSEIDTSPCETGHLS